MKEYAMETQGRTTELELRSDGVQRANRTTRSVSLASAGAVLVALQALSCPLTLILISIGVGTAWIVDLSALAPYQPIFYVLAAAQLGFGYYLVYWKPRKACAEGATSAAPCPSRVAKFSLWIASALVLAAIAHAVWHPLI